jgi:transcription antitermination protein NusB
MKKPGKRRAGRELAMQCLFHIDHNSTPPDQALTDIWDFKKEDGSALGGSPQAREFAEELVRGVLGSQKEIDERIRKTAANFDLHRIGGVERAILRMAIFEMMYSAEVPPVVAINEAVEVAKKYAAEEATSFVNGILDRVRSQLDRPARTPAAKVDWQTKKNAKLVRAEPTETPGARRPAADAESSAHPQADIGGGAASDADAPR